MWHRVEVVLTDVSEERIASIVRVEGKIRKSAREASVMVFIFLLKIPTHSYQIIGAGTAQSL
jgi:hypothetical protein